MAWDGSFFLYFFLTWIIHQYHLFEHIFPVCLQESASCSPGCRSMCVTLRDAQPVLASLLGTSKSLITDFYHLILGKSKCEKSLLKQYLHHQVGSRMFMKTVCHITCNLQSMNWCISYVSMLPGGKKCQNYLALHLFRNTSTWQIKASKPYTSLCPRSPREMRNLCVLYSPSL